LTNQPNSQKLLFFNRKRIALMRLFPPERHFSTVCRFLCLCSLSLLLFSCSRLLEKISPSAEHKRVSAEDIRLQFDPPSTIAAWGETSEVSITATWADNQKYPVQVTVPESPAWLSVETRPVILEPNEPGVLAITPALGEAELGQTTIRLEATAYGMKQPREFSYKVEITRQSGSFTVVLTGPVNQQCREVCGQVTDGRGQGAVDFYDLQLEQGQSCDGPLPSAQRINRMSYPVTEEGFGFGRTCRVALVASPGGEYNLVNIRLPGVQAGRGDVLLKLRNIQSLWLSRDNTVALALSGSSLAPYDVLTGGTMGESCRIVGSFVGATLTEGTQLSATADHPCNWTIR
jgi:hypothetical protein